MISVLNGAIRLHKAEQFPNPAEDGIWLAASVSPSPENKTLLDVGCGTGIVSLCLKHLWPQLRVTGLDIQPQALQLAAQNAILNNLSISWVTGDITNPPLKAESFDIVVSNPPFHLVEKGFDSAKNNLAFATTEEMVGLWVENILNLTKKDGKVYLIHHRNSEKSILKAAEKYHTSINHLETASNKPAKRILVKIDKGAPAGTSYNTIEAYKLRDKVLKTGKL